MFQIIHFQKILEGQCLNKNGLTAPLYILLDLKPTSSLDNFVLFATKVAIFVKNIYNMPFLWCFRHTSFCCIACTCMGFSSVWVLSNICHTISHFRLKHLKHAIFMMFQQHKFLLHSLHVYGFFFSVGPVKYLPHN